MKLRTNHLNSFLEKMDHLTKVRYPRLKKHAEEWKKYSEWNDTYWTKVHREQLEAELDKFREELGEIYDFMSERGLRNINGE